MGKILTMEQLVKFCIDNNLTKFSYAESGHKLHVCVPASFSIEEASSDSMLFANIDLMHTGRNRNGSNLTEDAALNCLEGIPYKPLLAEIYDFDGELDFTSHAMEEDEDGNMIYIEKQIGCFTTDKIYLDNEPDEEGRKFIHARVAIPREYTAAADIIERKNGTKISAELAINEMSFNAKDKELMLHDVEVLGATCLGRNPETGEEIGEGMKDAKLTLEDFSLNENSLKYDQEDKLVEALNKLNENLSKFNINNERKEESVMNHFEELLQKYNVTAEDIDFEYEGLSDEELDAAFAKKFDSEPDDPKPEDDGEEGTEGGEGSEGEGEGEADPEPTSDGEYALILPTGEKKEFSLSMDDKMSALYSLVNATYAEADNDWYCVDVYDDESIVVMVSWWSANAFRQKYERRDNEFALIGDREEVHRIWVTEDEENSITEAKKNYAEVSTKLSKFEAEPSKMEIFASDEWKLIADSDDFKALAEQSAHFDLSNDEITSKLNDMLLNAVKSGNYSQEVNPTEITESKPIVTKEPVKRGRYGGFSKK